MCLAMKSFSVVNLTNTGMNITNGFGDDGFQREIGVLHCWLQRTQVPPLVMKITKAPPRW